MYTTQKTKQKSKVTIEVKRSRSKDFSRFNKDLKVLLRKHGLKRKRK